MGALEEPPEIPPLAWRVHVVVPFDWKWSKNKMWLARAGSYGRRLSPEARGRREALAAHLLSRAPLWLQIHCVLPNHRGDAINCLDLVADAVEAATGLDDRWYMISGLTWSKVKGARPELHVWIGQAASQGGLVGGPFPGNLPP